MSNTLVDPPDLADYPGAPFAGSVVDAAVANLRSDVGWHIAPEVTETLTVDGSPDQTLILPTLRIVSVSAVRDVSGDTPVALTGWKMSARSGMLWRSEGWPNGFGAVEVDLTHGYTDTPAELLPVVAWYCRQQQVDSALSSETLGSWSESYRGPAAAASDAMEYPASTVVKYQTRTEA